MKRTLVATALIAVAVAGCAPTSANVSEGRNTPIGTPTQSTAPVVVEEDDPRWNCMTMGNKVCGPVFVPVSSIAGLGDALAEGDDATTPTGTNTAPTRNWEACMVWEGDTTYIHCPDGFTTTS